jgi:predicted acylesterase/phospholipase RssA
MRTIDRFHCRPYLRGVIVTFGGLFLGFFAPIAPGAEEAGQRVSIAISGGASKGAYEAGLNWAIVRILRYEAAEKDTVLTGSYRPFEAASMTGASAGGINAILSAMAWCIRPEEKGGVADRIGDNIFRNLWLKHDINTLLPAYARSSIYRDDDAVLARKSLIEEAEVLRSIWESPAFRKDCRVPLGVTVTRVEPEKMNVGEIRVKNQRFTFPFEFRTQDDGTAGFYFDPADYPLLLDYSMILIPYEQGAPKHKIDNRQIIDVVMTSAAFPVAFGRKRLKYCRMRGFYNRDSEPVEAGQAVSENGLQHCPEGYELSEAVFADGGLFDNLPIGLARTLAEEHRSGRKNPLPVTYIYIDPNRLRYKLPEKREFEKCLGANPPPACRELEYSFFSESRLLLGALGTAQSYELYRELTGDAWAHNLSQLAYQTADLLEELATEKTCEQELPFLQKTLPCHAALRFASNLLEISYDRIDSPITPPFSVKKLQDAGLIKRCRNAEIDSELPIEAECYIDFVKFRQALVRGLEAVLALIPDHNAILLQRLHNAQFTIYNDRIIRVTSRGAPITGELLEAFGAFLDLKFREYDYYVGVFDALVQISALVCSYHYSPQRQPQEFHNCRDAIVKRLHGRLGIADSKKGNYVFALLAKREFESEQAFVFAYDPMPPEDRDMRIIHDALANSLAAERRRSAGLVETTSGEVQFFAHLKQNEFIPTPAEDGSRPLLADIIEDPELWTYELTRRFTNRLLALEKDTERIYAEREPDPAERPQTNEAVLGGASFVLRSSTYKYPDYDFTPSTAPKEWQWRYFIPYEIAIDLVGGDLQFVWQPTWMLSKDKLLGVRGTVALAEGLVGESSHEIRDNYFSFGLSYSQLTGKQVFSSYGITPGYYRAFRSQESGGIDSFGGEVHIRVLQDKLRLALGARDFDNTGDSWYLLFGVTDIPGIVYWFSR